MAQWVKACEPEFIPSALHDEKEDLCRLAVDLHTCTDMPVCACMQVYTNMVQSFI